MCEAVLSFVRRTAISMRSCADTRCRQQTTEVFVAQRILLSRHTAMKSAFIASKIMAQFSFELTAWYLREEPSGSSNHRRPASRRIRLLNQDLFTRFTTKLIRLIFMDGAGGLTGLDRQSRTTQDATTVTVQLRKENARSVQDLIVFFDFQSYHFMVSAISADTD
jgi:hypothetical protein